MDWNEKAWFDAQMLQIKLDQQIKAKEMRDQRARDRLHEANMSAAMDEATKQTMATDTGFTASPKEQSKLIPDQHNESSSPLRYKPERATSDNTWTTVRHKKNKKPLSRSTEGHHSNTRPHTEKEASTSAAAASAELPSEYNSWGVESADGVVVGTPPAFPPGLLDWDESDKTKREKAVAQRRLNKATCRIQGAVAAAKRAATHRTNAVLSGLGLREEAQDSGTETGSKIHGSGEERDDDDEDWAKL